MDNTVENTKQCSKCKQYRGLNQFSEGRKNCNQCLSHRRKYRENHKEQISAYNKNYYEAKREDILEHYKDKIECFYCKCLVSKYKLKEHNNTIKHQNKMKEHNDLIKRNAEHIKYMEDVYDMLNVEIQHS